MKKLCALIVLLGTFTLYPCMVSHADINPWEIIAGTTVPETVLAERDGVKITAKGLNVTGSYTYTVGLIFNVQNTRDEEILIFPDDITVNLFEVDGNNIFKVPKHSNADYIFALDPEDIEMYGIEHIMAVSLKFGVDKKDYETIFETEEVAFVTSAHGQYVQQYHFPGTVIYDQKNIKITVLPQITEDYSGQNAVLYVENNAGYSVNIMDMEIVTVNGKIIESNFFAGVDAGKKSIEDFSIPWRDLAKNGIANINSIGMALTLYSNDPIYIAEFGGRGVGNVDHVTLKY